VGSIDLALGLLRLAAASRPPQARFHLDYGRALAGAGRLRDAAAELRASCDLAPDAAALRDLASVLYRVGELSEAERHFAACAALDPNFPNAHEALARLQYRRDALDESVASYRSALALQPALAKQLNIGFVRHRRPDGGGGGDAAPLDLPPPAWQLLAPEEAGTGALRDAHALRSACEERSLLIFDDFLEDPFSHRQRALGLAYASGHASGLVNFPGVQTGAQDATAALQRIANALGRDLKWDSPDNGAFRVSAATDSARCDIHVDSEDRENIFAAVLYLSLPEHCRGGTSFWRHRESGWERRPSREELAAKGYGSFLDFERRWIPVSRQRPFAELQQARRAAWDCVFEIPMRFNRLIVYRSNFFHAIGSLFGDRPDNARLVQLFYFQTVGG
jgi:tetratricopeptide (TPR) repeat protein